MENIVPKIINSKLEKGSIVEPFSHVLDSVMSGSSKIYKNCWITKSVLEENTFVGDGSKLDNCQISDFARVGKYNHLYYVSLGRHTYTGQDTVIMHTRIGDFSSISWGVTIGAAEHDFNRVTSHSFLYNPYDKLNDGKDYYNRFEKECEIGSDVWIGANSTVLRGVTIGDGAVIGANSIVTKSVPPYAIVAGNPARVIRYRFYEIIISRFLEYKWWTLDDETIRENCELFSQYPDNEVLDKIGELVIKQRGL